MSSCGTYTGAGAYTGSSLGAILGSAIGGISSGPRGSDIGTIVGMAGGAIVGGAIGNAADKARQSDYDKYRKARAARKQQQQTDVPAESGFDATNSGDDRIYDFNGSDYTGNYSAGQAVTNLPSSSSVENIASGYTYAPSIVVRNARFVDDNQDNALSRGELGKLIFEVYNEGSETLYDIQPSVVEVTGNKHIVISPSIHVEQIAPHQGIRYTALVKADNRLRDGTARFCVSVLHGNEAISKVTEFTIRTRK